jgi:hypothetical protein
MRDDRKERPAGKEATDANPEKMESGAERQEVPKEEAAV